MSRRLERVNELLRERLSELTQRSLKDPRISGVVTITNVSVSPDLSTARVYVSVFGTSKEKSATLEGLRSASPFLRRGLDQLSLRRIPFLTFVTDDSIEQGNHVLQLMKKVRSGEEP